MRDQPVDCNTKAEYLKKVVGIGIQQNVAVLKINLVNQLRKMADRKSRRLDGICEF